MISLAKIDKEIKKCQSDEGCIDVKAISESYEMIYEHENHLLKGFVVLTYHNDAMYEEDSPLIVCREEELFSWSCSPEEMIVLLGEKLADIYDYRYNDYNHINFSTYHLRRAKFMKD